MSLVISSGFGFDRITWVYAGSESSKSTESSSKSSRNLRADGPSRPQKPDISNLHKPDILIFGRHRGSQDLSFSERQRILKQGKQPYE